MAGGRALSAAPETSVLGRTYSLSVDDQFVEAEVWQEGQTFFVKLGDAVHEVSLGAIDDGRLFSLLVDGHSYEVHASRLTGAYNVLVGGEVYCVAVQRGHRRSITPHSDAASGSLVVRSPMTGIISQVEVRPGTAVARGTVLLTLESMKMNNELKAPRDASVDRVLVQPAQRVERGDPLIELKIGG
jgi:biotin carboxyl carrier protein